jgi:chemotaxis protein CheX
MDPNFIKPFVASVQNVFTTMMQLPVTIGEPRIKSSTCVEYDVSGIIGLSGGVTGSVVLSFPSTTAERIVALLSGQKVDSSSRDFADAIGELVNMVTGGAKALFPTKRASISCPTVVVGKGHTVAGQSEIPCVVIPCTTDCGEFAIEVAVKPEEAAKPQPAGATMSARN